MITQTPNLHKKTMPFWDHVEAFRTLLIRIITTLIAMCILSGFFFSLCAQIMNWPLIHAAQDNPEIIQGLVTTSPMGIFSVFIQVCVLGGIALSLPFNLMYIAYFISPALSSKEKKVLVPVSIAALCLFSLGALFSYLFILPASLAFSIKLNTLFGFKLIWSAPHYYSMVIWMTLGIGLCFEFPLAILALISTHLVSIKKLQSIRKHVLVGILIVGAAIIPGGDPISLIILAIPMYASYEGVIWIGKKIEAKRNHPNLMEI